MNRLLRLKPWFAGAAIVGLALSAPGLIRRDQAALHGYLIGLFFWTGLSLGSLGLLMINHTAGGRWGIVIRRPLEAAAGALPVCAVLFLPILFGAGSLYEWAHAADDAHIQKISAYLNVPFFSIRAVAFFAMWIGMAAALRRLSLRQDAGADVARGLQRVSAPGLLALVLSTTFAFTDWIMSLEPHWYSTIYGAMLLVGQAVGALAGAIFVAAALRNEPDMRSVANAERFHQLGNLLLAFVMFWVYLSFSQYLLIWSANLPEEVPWVIRRTTGGWRCLAVCLVVFHFAAPFFGLLFRALKRNPARLAALCAGLMLVRWFEVLWLVAPALRPDGFEIRLAEVAATVGVGGAWLWCYVARLAAHRLTPAGDPRFAEASS
jgi:hypothetical protein